MNNVKNVALIVFLFTVVFSTTILACMVGAHTLTLDDLGTEITINDNIPNSTYNLSPPGTFALGVAGEDNETEQTWYGGNTVTKQCWDLEGIYKNDNTSSMYLIGGFNYNKGKDDISVGDIFIGNSYVLDLNRDSKGNLLAFGTFDIIQGYTDVLNTTYVQASNPYMYKNGGAVIGTGIYSTNNFDLDIFSGWKGNDDHYVLAIENLPFLNDSSLAGEIVHLTLECGNDTLHGKMGSPVPLPGTFLLFSTGMVFLSTTKRRIFNLDE